MSPVREIGRGKNRRYQDPVKVKLLTDHSVRITEQDGDQFSISSSGKIKSITQNTRMGSSPARLHANVYEEDDSIEQIYYGRGYVQLTWWSNYATTGIGLGLGLDLLLNPEKVLAPNVSYALMPNGMITGKSFAYGKKLSQYLSGNLTDYVGARRIVNIQDKAIEIANYAKIFEEILFASLAKPQHDKKP